jgi:predicted NAD/FAD-dependent oxidoreductase
MMSDESRARVAIIGAGVAGLSCAAAIAKAVEGDGPFVELFDQGSRGRGGRASSSRPTTHDPPLVFDHGCQFFTAESEAFRETCLALERAGHIARWEGRFGTFDARTGMFLPKGENKTSETEFPEDFFRLLAADEVFVGIPTMRGLCDGLRALIPQNAAVDSPQCAVTSLEMDETVNDRSWTALGVDGRILDANESGSEARKLGAFEAVVVTDVMLAKSGTPGSCALKGAGLSGVTEDARQSDATGQREKMETFSGTSARARETWRAMRSSSPESLFSLMVAFEDQDALFHEDIPFDAAVVTGSEILQLLVRDSSKPGRESGNRWTAVSTAAYASLVLARAPLRVNGAYNPQTAEYLERVTPAMVEATRDVLCSASASKTKFGTPMHARSQRWGHAFPSKGWEGSEFAWDPMLRFGACGDFASGPGVEAAWESGWMAGIAVAETIEDKRCADDECRCR